MRVLVVALGLAVAVLGLGSFGLPAEPPAPWERTVRLDQPGAGEWVALPHAKRPTGSRLHSTGGGQHLPGLEVGTKPRAAPPAPGEGLVAFEGLSTWIDTYDTGLTPAQQVDIAAGSGVDTIFVQASRESTDGLIHDPERLAAVIERAHDRGLQVMVWTIPTFTDVRLDRDRAQAAMAFVTPRGDRPDAFGLDIEVDRLATVAGRTVRLLTLSAQLREWAGPDYPMAAIVLPPRQLEINTVWWPGFPYAELAEHYDVFVPMSYSSYRGTDAATTFSWNHDNVVRTRELVGQADLPVHLAGGIADRLPDVDAFVRAALATDVIGAGLYDLHTTRPEAWAALAPLRRDALATAPAQ